MTNIFYGIIRQVFDQGAHIDMISRFATENDYVCCTPDHGNFLSIKQIPRVKWGVQYFSLSKIQSNAAYLAQQGASFIGYDLEDDFSPAGDIGTAGANIVDSVTSAATACHNNGLQLCYIPGGTPSSVSFISQTASLVDMFLIQAELHQSTVKDYRDYVYPRYNAIKAAAPTIPILTELCTDTSNVDVPILTLKNCFQSVRDLVNGITIWSNKSPVGGDPVQAELIGWFASCAR